MNGALDYAEFAEAMGRELVRDYGAATAQAAQALTVLALQDLITQDVADGQGLSLLRAASEALARVAGEIERREGLTH